MSVIVIVPGFVGVSGCRALTRHAGERLAAQAAALRAGRASVVRDDGDMANSPERPLPTLSIKKDRRSQ